MMQNVSAPWKGATHILCVFACVFFLAGEAPAPADGALVIPTWILAAATIVLACATIGLFIYTGMLWSTTKTLVKDEQGNAKREQRAYLSVEPAGINGLIGTHDVIGHVAIHNVGKIPAQNVRVIVRMTLLAGRNIDTLTPGTPELSDRTIHPGTIMRQGSNDRTKADEIVRGSGENSVYVWGIVTYDDGFGDNRKTSFCHRYDCASYNRRESWGMANETSRSILLPEKARYHTTGNAAS